jgi:polyisoprenyl-phosphate glycosyltransferase
MVNERQLLVENNKLFISCIIPVYNEQAIIELFLTQLNDVLASLTVNYEIIIVDDGSVDHTIENILPLVKDNQAFKLIALSRNFGKELALSAGIDHCRGDVVILMDSDFQHPLAMIPEFIKYWAQGYNMVYGVRTDRTSESYLKRNFARLFYWLMEKITPITIPANAGDFRLLDKQVIDALRQFPERTRFMKGLYAWVGFKQLAVPYEVQERKAGESGWGFTKLADLALTGITSFSDIPLRVWGLIGFSISFIALIYAVYIVAVTLIYGADMPGFPTLVVAIMFLGGIQLLSIGILGEYIARIFAEVKQRPKYLIERKINFN